MTEDMAATCSTLFYTHKLGCAMPEPGDVMPGLGDDQTGTWSSFTGPVWTTRFFVDFVNFEKFGNDGCGPDRTTTFTNIPSLEPSDAPAITSNAAIVTLTRGPCS